MDIKQLHTILQATGYPVAFYEFKDTVYPPFISYTLPGSANVMADNKVVKKIENVRIELYQSKKDLAVETKLEDILDQYQLPYNYSEVFVKEDNMHIKIYETTIL